MNSVFHKSAIIKQSNSVLLLIAASILVFTSCRKVTGEGPVITEVRNRTNFNAISVRLAGNIYFKQDSTYHLEIMAQQNILDIIESPVINQELILRFKNNTSVRNHDDITVTVSGPDIRALKLSGSGNLYTSGFYNPADCELDVSGSGNIIMNQLFTNHLDASISGSGNIEVSTGTASHESLKISGSGSMDLLNVPAKTATSSTSGSGTIKVNLSERLEAKISGSGNIYYKGKPTITASVSGSGKLIAL